MKRCCNRLHFSRYLEANMKRRLILFLVAVLSITFAPLSWSSSADPAAGYQDLIKEGTQTIQGWETKANWALTFTAAAVVAGVLVSLLQRGSSPLYRRATIGLGAIIALITGLKPVLFSADYRVLQRSVVQGRQRITTLKGMLLGFDPTQSPENLATFRAEFLKVYHEIDAIEDSLSSDSAPKASAASNGTKTGGTSLRFPDLIPTVHAQSAQVQQHAPSNDSSYFFNGKGSSMSLSEAQHVAEKDALRQAARFFLERSKGGDPKAEPPQALLDVLLSASNPAKTSYDYDRGTKLYTFSISLQVSKGVEKLDLLRFRDPEVRVTAAHDWTDSGILVRQGELVRFTATGQLQWGDGKDKTVGPDGSTSKITPLTKAYPVRGFGAGGLIGRVDKGQAFKIGAKAEVLMPASGHLYLGINDNSFKDNKGEFRVTIVKSPAGK